VPLPLKMPATAAAHPASALLAHPIGVEPVTAAPRGTMRSKGAVLFQTGHAGRCRRPGNRLNGPRASVAQLDRALPSEVGAMERTFLLKHSFLQ
jgi:hypothetical protein